MGSVSPYEGEGEFARAKENRQSSARVSSEGSYLLKDQKSNTAGHIKGTAPPCRPPHFTCALFFPVSLCNLGYHILLVLCIYSCDQAQTHTVSSIPRSPKKISKKGRRKEKQNKTEAMGDEASPEIKPFWEAIWPVLACGAGLFSDGYVNNVRVTSTAPPPTLRSGGETSFLVKPT